MLFVNLWLIYFACYRLSSSLSLTFDMFATIYLSKDLHVLFKNRDHWNLRYMECYFIKFEMFSNIILCNIFIFHYFAFPLWYIYYACIGSFICVLHFSDLLFTLFYSFVPLFFILNINNVSKFIDFKMTNQIYFWMPPLNCSL